MIEGYSLGGPRNGLPERVNYVYRGTGADQVRVPAPPRPSRMRRPEGDGWCPECDYRLGSLGHELECGHLI